MIESESDEYNLSSTERQQLLKLSLINNEYISIILINKETQQKYTTLISLEHLKNLSKAFSSSKTIKDGLNLIKNTVESGNIILEEDPNDNTVEIRFSISLASGEYPPFYIKLTLESQEENKEAEQELPATFDYQGNKELENRYGNITNDTTEYVKPILKNEVKPPIMQLEYIEPILQVHYPDGTTKSKVLPPRIQEVNGHVPDITEEQFRLIREQMDKNTNSIIKKFSPVKDYSKSYRSNSVIGKTNSAYSTHTMSYYNYYNNNTFKNLVRPAMETDQTNIMVNNIRTLNQSNNNNMNNGYNKTFSDYSSSTYKPTFSYHSNNSMQNNNYNLNKTNYFYNTSTFNVNMNRNNNFNNIVERRPRMINMNKDINSYGNGIGNINRSLTNPKKTQEFNSYQALTNNNLIYTQQPNQFIINNLKKNPLDRNRPKPVLKTNNQISLTPLNNNYQFSKIDNINNIHQIKPKSSVTSIQVQQTQIQERLHLIQKQQQKLQEYQQQLAKIQQHQQQIQDHQKKLKQSMNNQNKDIIKKKSPINSKKKQYPKEFAKVEVLKQEVIKIPYKPFKNSKREQIKIDQNQPQKRKIISISLNPTDNLSKSAYKSSNEMWQNKNTKQLITQSHNPQTKKIISDPISSQDSSSKEEISQQQITLAQLASIQNQDNPNYQNLEAIILPNINQETHVEENQMVAEENIPQNDETENNIKEGDPNIEALFITEEGKIIFRNGLLRGIIHKYAEIDEVVSKIQDILLKGVKFNLVYKAFDLDDKAETFHKKCDDLEMSLVLVETDEDLRFGGFTTKNWKGNCIKKNDNNSFVFSLDKNKIYDVIQNEFAIGAYPKFGPVFFGCQIRIFDEFFKNGGTTCHAGLNFKTKNDFELNNGKQKFLVKDIEVYSLETINID